MDYTKLRVFFWLSVAGSAASLLSVMLPKYRLYGVLGLVVLVPSALFLEAWTGLLSVIRSGMHRFYRSFPVVGNHSVFDTVKLEYCYLGISFDTVFSQFEDWYRFRRPLNVKIRLLLLDPAPEADDIARFQVAHQVGAAGNAAELAAMTRRRVEDRVGELMALPQASHLIEIRFHRQTLRHWMHLIDGKWAWTGLLPKGKPGIEAPIMVLKRRPEEWTLLDLYQEEFEALWEASRKPALASGA